MIRFKKCTFEDIREDLSIYYRENNILIDVYWEERLLESNFYKIELDNKYVGNLAIDNKNAIIVFNVDIEHRHKARQIFEEAKRIEEVCSIFVPTSDEFLVRHALSNFRSIENDSHYTVDSKREVEDRNKIKLTLANISDIDNINELTNKYYKNLENEVKSERFYIASIDDEIVGFGHLTEGILMSKHSNIGMYVVEKHRARGIATSILIALKKISYEMGKEPIAGCYYYNHGSLKAQLNAGMCQATDLLRVIF